MSKSKFFTASSSSDESSSGSESSDDSPQVRRAVVARNRFAIESSSDSDSDSSNSGSSSGSSRSSDSSYETSSESEATSSSESEVASGGESLGDEATKRQKRMLRWLKDSDDERDTSKKVVAAKGPKPKVAPAAAAVSAASAAAAASASAVAELKPAEGRERIAEILRSRGRKGVDRTSLLQRLWEISSAMEGVAQWTVSDRVSLQSAEISVRLDRSQSGAVSGFSSSEWRELVTSVQRLMALAKTHAEAGVISETSDATSDGETENRRVLNVNIATYAELLDEELYRGLQTSGERSEQLLEAYVARMRDIPVAVRLLDEVLEYLRAEKSSTGLLQAKVALKLMEHLHYQSAATMKALHKSTGRATLASPTDKMRTLALTAAQQGGLKEKITALLMLAFYLGGGVQTEAELELVKRLIHCDMNEYLATAEVSTQIAYNRMLAQTGLAAFRLGKVEDAHFFLAELCGGNKTRELLAQSGSRGERTPEQERIERRRILPYHMHMDAEMVDSVYFLCAMILEMPNITGKSAKLVSRSFRKFLEHYERNVAAAGPPENFREALAVAGRALANGEIARASELVFALDFWSRIPDSPAVQTRLAEALKLAGLQSFLVGNLAVQDCYRLGQLAEIFQLDETLVKTEITAAILAGDLEGAVLDDARKAVVAKTVKTARFAAIAVELLEKLEATPAAVSS